VKCIRYGLNDVPIVNWCCLTIAE